MPRSARLTASITRSSPITRSARVMQIEGMFDIPPAAKSEQRWDVTLPLDEQPWNVGLIVGPSGCGKSSIARELFGSAMVGEFAWDSTRSIVDGFPAALGAREITLLLSSVGFSSPPYWLRPYGVLSTGQQFRVSMARALAELPDLAVVDEFTSVVDRTVAQIGAAAIAKTVRRRDQQFVAVTCHYDVEPWLDPDWVYEPAENRFTWRLLRRRPPLEIKILRVNRSAWRLFSHHHYLTAQLATAAVCFCAFIDDRPVSFHSFMPFVGRLATKQKAMRGHRSVTLPDFQGVGIGRALITESARIMSGIGYRAFSNSGHPAVMAALNRDPEWRMIRPPGRTSKSGRGGMKVAHANQRITASWEFIGRRMPGAEAHAIYGS